MLLSIRPVLVAAALVACGGGAAPPPNDHVRLDLPDAGAHPDSPPASLHAMGLPRGAVMVASLDASLALTAFPEIQSKLESRLDLANGTLSAANLGIDARRPIAIVFAPLTDGQRKLMAELRPLSTTNAPSPATAPALKRASDLVSVPPMRVLFPATDPSRVRAFLDAFFASEHWRGHGGHYARSGSFAEISNDATHVAVDVADGRSMRDALGAMHAAFGEAAEEVPALDGNALRVTWSPAELAAWGFLRGVATMSQALSGGSIDPAQVDRIAAQGFFEAGRLLVLAATDRGPFFDRVDASLRMSPFEITVRAQPGAAWTAPAPEAWKPGPSVALEGVWAAIEGTSSLSAVWSAVAPDPRKLLDMVRDGGVTGWFVGMPQLLAATPLVASELLPTDVVPEAPVRARFERTESMWMASGSRVFAGVMPAGTTRAAAECALAPAPKCAAKLKLKPNASVHQGAQFAKLLEVDHRWVVLVADDDASLKAKVSARSEGPMHVDLAPKPLGQRLQFNGALPDHAAGDLALEGGALVFRLVAR